MKYEKFNKYCFYKHKQLNLHCKYIHRIYGGWVTKTIINKFGFFDDECSSEIWIEINKLSNNDKKINLFENIGVFKVTLDNIMKKINLYKNRNYFKLENIENSVKNNSNNDLYSEIEIDEVDILTTIKKYISSEDYDLIYDFYFLELTNEDIGIKYNKPKTTIRDRRIKIQKKLKEALLDDGYDFEDLI